MLPHIQVMVDFPSIIVSYFDLVNDLLTCHPDKFLQLAADVQEAVIQSLLYGISNSSPEVAKTSLRTLSRLAVFYIQLRTKQQQQQAQQAQTGVVVSDAWTVLFGTVQRLEVEMRKFQQALLQLLLCERFADSVVDALADALFNLIIAHRASFMELVHAVLAAQAQQHAGDVGAAESLHARLQQAFERMLTANQVSLDAINQKQRFKFRGNVREFLQSVRSMLSQK